MPTEDTQVKPGLCLLLPEAAGGAAIHAAAEPSQDVRIDQAAEADEIPPGADPRGGIFGPMTSVLGRLLPVSPQGRAEIESDLKRAGRYDPYAYLNLGAIRYAATMSSILGFGFLLIVVPAAWEPWCLVGLAAFAAAGWYLPLWSLRRGARRRCREIEAAIPEAIELAGVAVEEGTATSAALDGIERRIRPVCPALADELAIVARQIELGGAQQALDNLRMRIDSPGVRSLVAALSEEQAVKVPVTAGRYHARRANRTIRERHGLTVVARNAD
jgi:tight adherence protein C